MLDVVCKPPDADLLLYENKVGPKLTSYKLVGIASPGRQIKCLKDYAKKCIHLKYNCNTMKI